MNEVIDHIMLEKSGQQKNSKYPFICCELLCLDNDQILSWFFPEEDTSEHKSNASRQQGWSQHHQQFVSARGKGQLLTHHEDQLYFDDYNNNNNNLDDNDHDDK